MIRIKDPLTLITLFAALGLAACSGGGSDKATDNTQPANSTSISVSLMDAPVDDLTAVNVVITALWLKPHDEPAIELPIMQSPYTVELLSTSEDNAALLVDNATIEPGEYEWLAMDVAAEIDGLTTDSNVETITGGIEELYVPSSRIRLVDGFEAPANAALELLFDWDLRKGMTHPPGLGAYLLKPAFRVIGTTAFGGISGSIPVATVALEDNACDADDADLDIGNAVYVYSGTGVEPDDIDEEMDVEPLAVLAADLNDDSTAYVYSTLLPFGDYTVAFTCQAANDLPESNDLGNEDPGLDTVAFFVPTVDVSLSDTSAETAEAVVDF